METINIGEKKHHFMNLANWKLYHYWHVIFNSKCYVTKYNDIEIHTKTSGLATQCTDPRQKNDYVVTEKLLAISWIR